MARIVRGVSCIGDWRTDYAEVANLVSLFPSASVMGLSATIYKVPVPLCTRVSIDSPLSVFNDSIL